MALTGLFSYLFMAFSLQTTISLFTEARKQELIITGGLSSQGNEASFQLYELKVEGCGGMVGVGKMWECPAVRKTKLW